MIAALLGRLWAGAAGWLAAIGAALAAIGAIYLAGARAERHRSRARDLAGALERRGVRDEVERDVARDAGAAGRLRERWSRD
jgi:hypothetical protein